MKNWFYACDYDSVEIFYQEATEPIPMSTSMNIHGPFVSFSDAKNDALEKYKATQAQAKIVIRDIREIKKIDSKEGY